jgi:hypothetical protein
MGLLDYWDVGDRRDPWFSQYSADIAIFALRYSVPTPEGAAVNLATVLTMSVAFPFQGAVEAA